MWKETIDCEEFFAIDLAKNFLVNNPDKWPEMALSKKLLTNMQKTLPQQF